MSVQVSRIIPENSYHSPRNRRRPPPVNEAPSRVKSMNHRPAADCAARRRRR